MKCLIFDDNAASAAELKRILEEVSPGVQVCIAQTAQAAQAQLADADILFQDICVGSENGVDFVREKKRINPELSVVFITAHTQIYPEVFSLDTTDGILFKPFQKDLVRRTLRVVENNRQTRQCFVYKPTKGNMISLSYAQILYFETHRRHIYLHTDGGTEPVIDLGICTIKELLPMLPPFFICIHQSIYANINRVAQLVRYSCIFDEGTKCPVAQGRYLEARTAWEDMMGNFL